MAVTHLLVLALPRAGLEEGLNRLSSLSAFASSVDNQLSHWECMFGREWTMQNDAIVSYSTVHSPEEYLKVVDDGKDISTHITFRTSYSADDQKIILVYHQEGQREYKSDLELAVLDVRCVQYGASEEEAANLFLPQVRPGLFRLLEAFNPLYGYISSLAGMTDHDLFYGPDDPYEPPDKLLVNAPIVIGQQLIPTLGLERLRAAEPFAKFELAGPMFIYANHSLFYKITSNQVKALSEFTHQTSWATPQYLDFDDYLDQCSLSDEKLNAALSLPVEIDVREL